MKNLKSLPPLVYLITDRRRLARTSADSQVSGLIGFLERAIPTGIDMVQLREPDLSARDLFLLTKSIVELSAPYGCKVLVNDRADLAAVCGAGVHLTTRSMRPAVVRRAFGDGLLMGVSTHNAAELQEAEDGGANFAVFGPVYETESKRQYGRPVGLAPLQDVSSRFKIPVLALGGIKENNYLGAVAAGAAGIAGISLFTESPDLTAFITQVKAAR